MCHLFARVLLRDVPSSILNRPLKASFKYYTLHYTPSLCVAVLHVWLCVLSEFSVRKANVIWLHDISKYIQTCGKTFIMQNSGFNVKFCPVRENKNDISNYRRTIYCRPPNENLLTFSAVIKFWCCSFVPHLLGELHVFFRKLHECDETSVLAINDVHVNAVTFLSIKAPLNRSGWEWRN